MQTPHSHLPLSLHSFPPGTRHLSSDSAWDSWQEAGIPKPFRRAGGAAGSAGPSSSTSPSSPRANMVRAVLSRAWSAPADGRTDSRTDPPGTRRAASWTSPAPALSPRAAVALISCLGAGFGQHSGKEAGAKPRSLQSRQGSN